MASSVMAAVAVSNNTVTVTAITGAACKESSERYGGEKNVVVEVGIRSQAGSRIKCHV